VGKHITTSGFFQAIGSSGYKRARERSRAVCGMSQHLSKRPEQLFTARCAQMKGEVKGRKEVANKKTNQNRKLFGSSLVGGISIIA